MNRELAFLQIPEDYFRGMTRVPRWSAAGEAIEWPDETTLAFGGEVALFLEGYALVGPPIHFAHVVHLLELFDSRLDLEDERAPVVAGDEAPRRMIHPRLLIFARQARGLIRAFREAGRPMRNLGALSAWLCREVPAVADPPDIAELCGRLSDGSLLSDLAVLVSATAALSGEAEAPAITATDFAARFLRALRALDPAAITAWLKHGRGPGVDSGDRLARAIEEWKPRTLEGALAAVATRERLAGSIPMVGPLLGALALPPRRLADRALPTGGYSDVGTRGRPEQILPSQFAIDEDEFLRRFAENELLYFHREEPHAPLTEELVLLLDQGVRTWGRVRVALAAAALALGRLAARRKLALAVGSSGSGGRLLDPTTADPDSLGRLWEASDLTVDPGPALESLLREKGDGARDVVVLSHPRSLAGLDFAAATRGAGAGTRVFSVAVDEAGRVEFREWRRGVAVKIGDFRVDFTPPSAPGPDPTGHDPRCWKGDVEPVGFPFRFGVVHRLERPLFDLDHAGRRLLLATQRGILHAWALDGSRSEILPRAVVEGEVMEQVDAVLGAADGFVVAGRVGKSLVAMHYDFHPRTARAFVLGPTFDHDWQWFYSRKLHTVVARGRDYSRSVDLSTGEIHRSRDANARPPARAIRAFAMASGHSLPPPRIAVVDEARPAPASGRSVRLDRHTGEVHLVGVTPAWDAFTPLSDGRPVLRGHWIDQAQFRGDVLALALSGPEGKVLRLFRGPAGPSGRELPPTSSQPDGFMLSPDGRLIARRLGDRQIEVRETAGNSLVVFATTKGKVHTDLSLTLGRYGMILRAGRHGQLLRWETGRLAVTPLPEGFPRFGTEVSPWPVDRPATRRTPRPSALDYDPRRFIACARSELTAVVDAFGQVALFDRRDRLLAMFATFRSQVAAWMPDGTRLGPSLGPTPLIEGPVTPNAAEIIGRALKAASDEAILRDQDLA